MGVDIIQGDATTVLKTLPDASVNCCVTSPPYWGLRDYGVDGQLGLERTPEEYVAKMVEVFREVRRVLRDDGALWLNLGISYAGSGVRSNNLGGFTNKQKTNLGSFCGKQPNQFHSDAPACGTDDKVSQGSQVAGRVCLGCDDAHQVEIQNHHGCNAHIVRSASQDEQQTSQTGHDSERSGCVQESQHFLQPDVQESTIEQSSCLPSGASSLEATVSASQPSPSACSHDVQPCADKSACTSGTSQMMPPLVVRTQGKESFFSACRRSDCKGIGMCGLCWTNLTIPYLNVKPKDELNIPHLVAMALQADGWFLRQTIVWAKNNPMPESVTDRCTKAHEYIFLMSKSQRYFYDAAAIKEPSCWPNGPNSPESIKSPYGQGFTRNSWKGSEFHTGKTGEHQLGRSSKNRSGNNERKPASSRGVPVDTGGRTNGAVAGSVPWEGSNRNKRSVWTVSTAPFPGAHFATFPPKLIEPCILAGCPAGGTVLDPFGGSGTTGMVAEANGRNAILIELNPKYIELIKQRTRQQNLFAQAGGL